MLMKDYTQFPIRKFNIMYIPDMMRIVRNKSNIIFIRNYNCKILSIN